MKQQELAINEKRKYSRILFAANAFLKQEQRQWSTQLLDLSLNGALVKCPNDFPTPTGTFGLDFTLPSSDITIQMTVELVHQRDELLGLKCHFIDIDSISHLKRIVELNLGDASILGRELTFFVEQHDQAASAPVVGR